MISFIQPNENYLTAEMFLNINYGYRFCQWLMMRHGNSNYDHKSKVE